MDPFIKYIISTFRQKYVDTCINNIILVKHIVSQLYEVFPSEVIFFIISMIWKMQSQLHLNRYDSLNNDLSRNILTLGDIIDAMSDLGKVQILDYSREYKLFIEFHNPIKYNNPSGIPVNTNSGETHGFPFSINNINGARSIGPHCMYIYLQLSYLEHITDNLYILLNKEYPELSKCYLKSIATWNKFQYRTKKETERQIMIVLIRHFTSQAKKKGFYLYEQ